MTKEKSELGLILEELETEIKSKQDKKEWLKQSEFAKLIGITGSTIQQFKDREAFLPYRKYEKDRCFIKNCPEAIKLMRCYKYRNFEYEKLLLADKVDDGTRNSAGDISNPF